MKISLGMRTIKTAVAIYFSLVLAKQLNLSSGALAGVTAVVCMQPSLISSLKTIKNRVLATVIGSFIAVLITHYFGSYEYSVSIASILTILICLRFNWQDSIPLALITLILIADSSQGEYLHAVQDRLIAIFIGLTVAFLLNFVFPPKHTERLVNKVDELRKKFDELYQICINDILEETKLTKEEVKIYTVDIRNLLEEAREIYHLSIDSIIGYNENREKDEFFLIKKSINAIQSNLERLLEIHRSILFAPTGPDKKEIRENMHFYLKSIFSYHQKIYNHVLFGQPIEERIINRFTKERKILEQEISELLKKTEDLSPLHFYNMLAEGERIMNKAWSLIENKEKFNIDINKD